MVNQQEPSLTRRNYHHLWPSWSASPIITYQSTSAPKGLSHQEWVPDIQWVLLQTRGCLAFEVLMYVIWLKRTGSSQTRRIWIGFEEASLSWNMLSHTEAARAHVCCSVADSFSSSLFSEIGWHRAANPTSAESAGAAGSAIKCFPWNWPAGTRIIGFGGRCNLQVKHQRKSCACAQLLTHYELQLGGPDCS